MTQQENTLQTKIQQIYKTFRAKMEILSTKQKNIEKQWVQKNEQEALENIKHNITNS